MRNAIFRIMAVCILSSLLFGADVSSVFARRFFSPDTEEVYFHRVCRDGVELQRMNTTDDVDLTTYPPTLTQFELRQYTGPIDDHGITLAEFNTLPHLASGATILRGYPNTLLSIDDGEGFVHERNIYSPRVMVAWPYPLVVGTPIIMDMIVDYSPTDLPLVEDCYLFKSGFTYQGYLADLTGPATGQYDFRFTLYLTSDSVYGKVGEALERTNVAVTNGVFTTELTFDELFNGTPSWLAIEVRPTNTLSYQLLTPRQPLYAAPYALSLPGVTMHNEGTGLSMHVDGAIETSSYSSQPAIIARNAANGNGVSSRVNNANAINAHNDATYATIYAEKGGIGNGVAAQVENGNAINAHNTSTYATVYGENSGAGTGGWFTSFSGANILVAQEEVTEGSFNTRFRVALNGDVYADGRFVPGGADFAEMLPSASGLEPGDVLIIDAQGILNRSTTPNAPNVAGVYSTKPGIIGGLHEDDGATMTAANLPQQQAAHSPNAADSSGNPQATDQVTEQPTGSAMAAAPVIEKIVQPDLLAQTYAQQGKAPLALVGIVPVKVSAENGAIQPGDLLTTSAIPGHAMKATPVDLGGVPIYRPGTIIGKALEPLGAGTGVIRALITLQ